MCYSVQPERAFEDIVSEREIGNFKNQDYPTRRKVIDEGAGSKPPRTEVFCPCGGIPVM